MSVRLPRSPGRVWRGLRLHQLFALIILPLAVLALAFALGGAYLHQQVMRRMVGERDALTVRAAANTLQAEVNHRLAAIRSLALRAGDSSTSLQSILDSSAYLQNDFDLGLAFASPDGSLLAVSGGDAAWGALLASGLAELGTGGSSLMVLEDRPIVLVGSYLPDGSSLALGAFSVDGLGAQVLATVLPHDTGARIFLVDARRNLIFESGGSMSPGDLAEHPGVSEALGGESGTIYIIEDGEEHVVAYSPVQTVGWALVLEEDWQSVATPLSRTTEVAPLALIPVLLIAIAGIWFGVRQIVQPLQSLEAKAASLASGNFRPIEESAGGITEIRRLQAEMGAMARKVQAAQESLHDYIGAITNAQEEERRRLARDLHDDTLQSLIALKQRIQLVQGGRRDRARAASLRELEALAEQTIVDLRRLTRDLRPIYLEDLGLVTALEMLGRETGEAGGIPVRFQRKGDEHRLSPQVELSIYRIAQEALNNVVRHAHATRAMLSIEFREDAVRFEVEDDGQGFETPRSPAAFAVNGHYGLLGLHERAELIGADLEIASSPGRGTRLTISLPLDLPGAAGQPAT